MLKKFRCFNAPNSRSTIKSVPPAKARHTPGSRASSSSASLKVFGARKW
jgi:hypothetical protein